MILDGLGINDTNGDYAYAQKLADWRSTFIMRAPSVAALKAFQTVVNRRLMQAQARTSSIPPQAVGRLKEWQEWVNAYLKK